MARIPAIRVTGSTAKASSAARQRRHMLGSTAALQRPLDQILTTGTLREFIQPLARRLLLQPGHDEIRARYVPQNLRRRESSARR